MESLIAPYMAIMNRYANPAIPGVSQQPVPFNDPNTMGIQQSLINGPSSPVGSGSGEGLSFTDAVKMYMEGGMGEGGDGMGQEWQKYSTPQALPDPTSAIGNLMSIAQAPQQQTGSRFNTPMNQYVASLMGV